MPGAGMNENWSEYAFAWFFSLVGAATIIGARIGAWLYGPNAVPPPEEPERLHSWKRRRLWIVVSELSSLPAFASLSVVATVYYGVSPWFSIPISMGLAIVGFLLLLDGVQRGFRVRFGVPEHD